MWNEEKRRNLVLKHSIDKKIYQENKEKRKKKFFFSMYLFSICFPENKF